MRGLHGQIHTGIAGIDRVRDALAALDDLSRFPLTVRASCARLVALRGSGYPWLAVVRAPSREVVAAALLLSTERPNGLHFSGVRLTDLDDIDFPARDRDAAETLADAVASRLQCMERPWALDVRGIDVDDPVAGSLSSRLAGGRLELQDGPRRLSLDTTTTTAAHLPRDFRSSIHRGRRAVDRRGVAIRMWNTTSPAPIRAALDRWAPVDGTRGTEREERLLRRSMVEAMASRGRVELTALELDDQPAAYALALREAPEYRILAIGASATWDEFFPAHQLVARVIGLAKAEPSFHAISWLSSPDGGAVMPGEPQVRWRLTAGVGNVG